MLPLLAYTQFTSNPKQKAEAACSSGGREATGGQHSATLVVILKICLVAHLWIWQNQPKIVLIVCFVGVKSLNDNNHHHQGKIVQQLCTKLIHCV